MDAERGSLYFMFVVPPLSEISGTATARSTAVDLCRVTDVITIFFAVISENNLAILLW